jgi:hypothetical protein
VAVKTWGQGVNSNPDGCAEMFKGCLAYLVLGGAISGLSSIEWQFIWGYLLSAFGLFPSLPSGVNAAFSAVVYAEAAGCIVASVYALIYRREGWRPALSGLGVWTGLCAFAAVVVLLVWGVSSFDSKAAGGYVGTRLGAYVSLIGEYVSLALDIFPSLPSAVNGLFSLAVYVAVVGCLSGLIFWARKKDRTWVHAWKVMQRWGIASFALIAVALAGWGLVALIGALGGGVYVLLVAGRLMDLLVIMVVTAAVIAFLTLLTRQMLKMRHDFEGMLRPPVTDADWKQQFRGLSPRYQARRLKDLERGLFELKDDQLLLLLEEIEADVGKDPAQSAYWEKRYEIESITRQHRVG